MVTLTEDEIVTRSENAEVFLEALDLVIKNMDGKVNVYEMSDCLLAVGFDMLYHIVSHAMPGEDTEKKIEGVNVHIDEIKKHLEENVWRKLQQPEKESE